MTSARTILIVEDDAVMRASLRKHLARRHRVLTASTCAKARHTFEENRVDLVILDLHLPDGDGLSLVQTFNQGHETVVIVITAFPKIQTAVRALKAGALDYINKPFDLEEFDIVIDKALDHRGLRREVMAFRRQRKSSGGAERILGESPAIEQLRTVIRRVAATPDTTILIRGESGTGKEIIADAIHHESDRSDGQLVRVNCSSIPATMMDAELFGHERGAFTDAKSSRCGLIETAHGGTMFLDEIGDMPIELQPKLLRVLETKCIRRLGGRREFQADVRFVAATNRDLEALVSTGAFREDLLYRLNVFEIIAPTLRERRGDIAQLAVHFLTRTTANLGMSRRCFSPKALTELKTYDWPGNVRELRNVVERAAILSTSSVIDAAGLPINPRRATTRPSLLPESLTEAVPLAELEQRYVRWVYDLAEGNKTRAASVLGITRVTLRDKLSK